MQTFNETQKLKTGWIKIIYILVRAVLMFLFYVDIFQIWIGKPFGPKPATNIELCFLTIIVAIVVYLFHSTALVTCIDDQGVKYKWIPFQKHYRVIKWSEIKHLNIIKNRSPKIGYSTINNLTTHGVLGKSTLKLILNDDRQVEIGTQKEVEMANKLEKRN